MKYSTSKPEGMPSKKYWADKSQDAEWLRGGFLARGVEIDIMQQRIFKLLAAYSAHEIAVEGYQRACFWYRIALATAIGVSILRWLT